MSLLFSLCVFVLYTDECMCKLCFATDKLESVPVMYMVNMVTPLNCCTKGGIFLSLFLHSFLCLFFSHISPGLPSSHPNQRTHRRLLGTPCPGNPPCIARYLEETMLTDEYMGNKVAVRYVQRYSRNRIM